MRHTLRSFIVTLKSKQKTIIVMLLLKFVTA